MKRHMFAVTPLFLCHILKEKGDFLCRMILTAGVAVLHAVATVTAEMIDVMAVEMTDVTTAETIDATGINTVLL